MHLAVVVAAASAVAFALMGFDKRRARRRGRRVPEWALVLGPTPLGVLGTVAGMAAFRHKTRKPAFWLKVAVAAALDAALLVAVPGLYHQV